MSQTVEVIIIIASVITALGTIIGCFTTILKGLKEQGCDGPVTEAICSIENHLNKEAHK